MTKRNLVKSSKRHYYATERPTSLRSFFNVYRFERASERDAFVVGDPNSRQSIQAKSVLVRKAKKYYTDEWPKVVVSSGE